MDHNFVLNAMSFPAADASEGYSLLYSTLKGMLAVGGQEDRFALYCDNIPDLKNLSVAQGYTYSDFLDALVSDKEEDLLVALMEIDDKTPMLDHLSEADFEKIASTSFYFPDEGYEKSVDIIAVAWRLAAVLLSIPTSEKWRQTEIPFAQFTAGQTPGAASYLRNVACESHGRTLRLQHEEQQRKPLQELYPNCKFSADFVEWVDGLVHDLKAKVNDKFALAYSKEFQGGEPLFKTLNNADGMREIRFDAVQGGAVRILFGGLNDGKQAVLIGFVKKSNSEGYAEAIKTGARLWTEIRNEKDVASAVT
jgi:phage-related protein